MPVPNLHIRPASAKAIVRTAKMLCDLDVISFDEVGVIRHAMRSLARNGTLPTEPEKRLLDLHEVAQKLSIGESTLKRLLAAKAIALPKVKIGGAIRFRLADVEALMDNVTED